MARSKSRRKHAHPSISILPPAKPVARVAKRPPPVIQAVVLARKDMEMRQAARPKKPRRLALLAVSGADARKSHPAGRNRPVVNIYGQPSFGLEARTPRPPAAHAVFRNGVWRSADGRPMKSSERVPVGLGFRNASKIVLCVKRKMRREVLLAKGFGGGSHRKGKRKFTSNIWC